MRSNLTKAIGKVALAGLMALPLAAASQGYGNAPPANAPRGVQQQGPAQPGTVNFVEGQTLLNGQPVDKNQVGSLQLQAGQSFATQNGRAEILLIRQRTRFAGGMGRPEAMVSTADSA